MGQQGGRLALDKEIRIYVWQSSAHIWIYPAVYQAGDADQEEIQYFGHQIGPRSPFETPLIPRDAKFRGGSFYDGFEAIRGELRG